MEQTIIYDIGGIGIGPFNLGLAALSAPIKTLSCIFFESKPAFEWHGGMLLDSATLQVPFFADLITAADPTSSYGYLSYLKQTNRLYQFAALGNLSIFRKDYNRYCQWVAAQLPSLRFNHQVTAVHYLPDSNLYELTIATGAGITLYQVRHLVIGIGSEPWTPPYLLMRNDTVFHSSQYLYKKKGLLGAERITIIGSGQSAAEIFYDLLEEPGANYQHLNWFTKAQRFYPMETSKFTFEMTSPDYIQHFFQLTPAQKKRTLAGQQYLYKGIREDLIETIYQSLYRQQDRSQKFRISPACEIMYIEELAVGMRLHFRQVETENTFSVLSDMVILATGYQAIIPSFLAGIRSRINFNSDGLYQVNKNYSIDTNGSEIFVQNAEMHTHGFNAPDLGMGPYRNAVILNQILGYAHFQVENRVAFQCFDPD